MACCSDTTNSRQRIVRQCTDVLWLFIFIVFLCFLIFIAAFAIVYGNPLLLINGYDSFGNICGTTNEMSGGLVLSGLDMTDRPYLFDLDVQNVQGSMKLCVKKCPTRDLNSLKDLQDFYEKTGSMLCRYDFNFSMLNDKAFIAPDGKNDIAISSSLGPCPILSVFKSEVVLQRCVPGSEARLTIDVLSSMYASLNSPAALEQLLSGLYSTWTIILLLTLFAIFLSLILVLMLKQATGFTTWTFMVTTSVSALVGTGLLWWTYCETKWELDETPPEQMLEVTARNERWLLALAILATCITLVLLALVVHVGRHVSRLVQLFQEASNCLKALPILILQPIITVCVLLGIFVVWTYVVLCLATAMQPEAKPLFPFRMEEQLIEETSDILSDSKDSSSFSNFSIASIKTFTLLGFSETLWVRYCWWVYILALIWVSELVLSCQQMATAGAVVNWYFHKDRHRKGNFLVTSVRRLVFYHMGSVVLGSLLILICKVPRLILRFTSHRLKSEGSCARCGRQACCCCLCCYDRGLRVVNHNAYAVIAIEGLDFCPAAHVAYSTMESNALQFAMLNSVGDCLLFLGKCSVTAVTGCCGLFLMHQDLQLHLYAVPLLLLCAFSFFISHAVFTLYEMVLDSLFLCVAEDRALSISENAYYRPGIVSDLTTVVKVKRHCPEAATTIERQPMRQYFNSPHPSQSFAKEMKETQRGWGLGIAC